MAEGLKGFFEAITSVLLTLAAQYADWHALTAAALADLTPDARAAIMGGNAARLYGVAP